MEGVSASLRRLFAENQFNERFYEKVKKVKADVAAFSYLFLHRGSSRGGKLSRAVADRQRSS
jgi:hypothetical protein